LAFCQNGTDCWLESLLDSLARAFVTVRAFDEIDPAS
jgi:hypothetical protein